MPCIGSFLITAEEKKAHILPVRQNKQMHFKVYQGAVLLNKCLLFMYNYFLTETALQTRHKIWSMDTSRPFVCMRGNEGSFWKIKNLPQQHTMLSKKTMKEYGALNGPKKTTASDELFVHFSRSIFVTNFHGSEWRPVLYKRYKLQWKQHHAVGSYFTSQKSLPSPLSKARICLQPWFTNAFSHQRTFFTVKMKLIHSSPCIEQCRYIFPFYSSMIHFTTLKFPSSYKSCYLERIKNGKHSWPSCLKPLGHSISLKSQEHELYWLSERCGQAPGRQIISSPWLFLWRANYYEDYTLERVFLEISAPL